MPVSSLTLQTSTSWVFISLASSPVGTGSRHSQRELLSPSYISGVFSGYLGCSLRLTSMNPMLEMYLTYVEESQL